MARRGVPKAGPSWFIREWMDYLGKSQVFMQTEAGWSKASASQIYNGKQDYSPKIVAEAALALNVEPYELLMTPEAAMALRRFRAEAQQVVELVPKSEPQEPAAPKSDQRSAKRNNG